MLNPFPSLLVYGILAPTLLRVVVAVCFMLIAKHIFQNSTKIKATTVPLIGRPSGWMVWISVLLALLIAFFLFVGLGVQWAALLGLILSLKHALLFKRIDSLTPFSRSTMLLLALVCLSLLLSGAGAYAFDVRL